MSVNTMVAALNSFSAIYTHLKTYSVPLLPPPKPYEPVLSSQITSLQLHPTIEAALHILNLDLASAHFLVRHMQSAPAFEGMYLHGILHRIEGDYNNARYWYSDVHESEVYQDVWGRGGVTFKEFESRGESEAGGREDMDDGQKFLDRVQALEKSQNREELERESRRELDTVVQWCIGKFGTERMADATEAWTKNSEEIRKIGEDQVSGDAGRRNF